jgi:integrase
VTFTAGTGMRQGEVLGLTLDRLHMLRREVVVDRQLVTLAGRATAFGPLKTKASYRTIPLPQIVVDVLAEHLATYGAGEHDLVFTDDGGARFTRQAFGRLWRPAAGCRARARPGDARAAALLRVAC